MKWLYDKEEQHWYNKNWQIPKRDGRYWLYGMKHSQRLIGVFKKLKDAKEVARRIEKG